MRDSWGVQAARGRKERKVKMRIEFKRSVREIKKRGYGPGGRPTS
jgi:hypothetical protein